MSLPYMPIYIADYLAATSHLDAAQSGAYLHLLMHYWQKGSLPSDDPLLGRIARMTPRQWRDAKPILQGFFFDGWKHRRVESELEKARLKGEARAVSGHLGGTAKALKIKELSVAKATDLLEQTASKSLPSSSELRTQEVREKPTVSCPKRVRTRVEYPDEFQAFWRAYPVDPIMSKQEAFQEFSKLSAEDQANATRSCPAFRAYCAGHATYRPVHAVRYLSQRRFDSFTRSEAIALAQFFVEVDTPQWRAWEAHWRRTEGKSPPVDKAGRGWNFASEWPPKSRPVLVETSGMAEMRG
jgi:uncharacterized protein YdaU (DUF1376 family)